MMYRMLSWVKGSILKLQTYMFGGFIGTCLNFLFLVYFFIVSASILNLYWNHLSMDVSYCFYSYTCDYFVYFSILHYFIRISGNDCNLYCLYICIHILCRSLCVLFRIIWALGGFYTYFESFLFGYCGCDAQIRLYDGWFRNHSYDFSFSFTLLKNLINSHNMVCCFRICYMS